METKRLVIRRFRAGDLEDLYEYLSDETVVRFEPYRAMTLEQVRENLRWRISAEEMLAVERKEDGKLIGNVYFAGRDFESAEIGYVFNRKYWGMGYAREACEAVIDAAFGEGLHRVYAECDPENESSWKLLERLGFTREAHLRKNVYFWRDDHGLPVWKDTYIYARLSGE